MATVMETETDLIAKIRAASYGRSMQLEVRAEETEETDGTDGQELTFSFSSELPVERWWGTEILSHEKGCARLERLNDRGAFLFNHDRNRLLGSTLKAWIGDDKRAYVTIRWSNRDEVQGIRQDCEDGHLTHVSFAYDIYEIVEKTKEETYTVTDWEAFEVSLVTIPADPTVGVGRDRAQCFGGKIPPENMREKPMIWGSDRPAIVIPSSRTLPANVLGTEASVPKHFAQVAPPSMSDPRIEREEAGSTIMTTGTVEETAQDIRRLERERVEQIRSLGEEHHLGDEARAFIDGDRSIEEFRTVVLAKITERAQDPIAKPAEPLGLSEKEKKRYSVLRALQAAVTNNWKGAGFEKECSEEIADQRGKEPGLNGFYIPMLDLNVDRLRANSARSVLSGQQRTTYSVGNAATAGVTVETDLYPDFLEYLRNVPLVMQFGAQMWTGLDGNLDILRQTQYSTVGWIAEDDPLPEGNGAFELFGLRPKDLGAWSRITRRMLQQSSLDIENFVREELILGIALEIDRAAIHGTGIGNEPRGILNTPGIGNVALGANGGPPTWNSIVALETAVATQNALMSNVAYLTTPKARGKLKTTPKSTSFVSEFIWQDSGILTPSGNLGTLNGYLAGATNQVRSNLSKGTGANLSATVFGNWREMIFGQWGYLKVDANPYGDADFIRDAIKIKAINTIDIQIGRAICFAALTDMDTN
jgi:HK97 family phage major capsid protein/HK97 family phage prohead protease